MIDHHEQHCRQILIDELEAVYPSLSVWASAEFDAGVSAARLRSVLFAGDTTSMGLLAAAKALADSVQRDETGDMIGGQFIGNGNGGNISRDTLKARDRLQLIINDINNLLLIGGKEG